MRLLRHIASFACVLVACSAGAQVQNNAAASDTAKEQPKGIDYTVEPADSTLKSSVYMFRQQPLEVKIQDLKHPVFDPTGVQFHDRLDGFDGNHYLQVTELGHPQLPTYQNFASPLSPTYKPNLFGGYFKTPDNVTLYQVRKPYTLLAYHSSLKRDYQLHITHSQNITPRWNVALDYHLVSPKGTYSNSGATNHFLDFNTNYYSRDARYRMTSGVIWQRMLVDENYGMANDSVFTQKRLSNVAGIPFNRSVGSSNNVDLTVFVRQSFNTVRQFEYHRPVKHRILDTVGCDTIWDVASSGDSLARYRYDVKVRDSIVGYDTLLPYAPMVFNTGVFGLDLQWDRNKYRYIDSLQYNHLSARVFWTNDAYMDHRWRNPLKLHVGIRPHYFNLQLDPTIYSQSSVTRWSLYPFAQVMLSPWPATELKVLGEVGTNRAEYDLDATLLFPFRDTLGRSSKQVGIRAVVKSHNPDIIYETQQLRTNYALGTRQLDNVGVRKVEGNFTLDSLIDAQLAVTNIANNVWFEQQAINDTAIGYVAHQAEGSAWLLQCRVNMRLQMWSWLHYDMQQLVQYASDNDQIRVPVFASKNSVYADFWLFRKVLRTQVGVDIRYHTLFKADGYDPGLGIFYRQNEVEVGNYLWGDIFLNLQIKRASIYVKAGHINELLEPQAYCILPHYPTKPFGLYFGLVWQFFD